MNQKVKLKNPLVFNTTKEARDFRRGIVGEDLLDKTQSVEASKKIKVKLSINERSGTATDINAKALGQKLKYKQYTF